MTHKLYPKSNHISFNFKRILSKMCTRFEPALYIDNDMDMDMDMDMGMGRGI